MDTGATYWPKVVLRSTVVYGSDNRTCQLAVGKNVAGFVDINHMAYVPAFNPGLCQFLTVTCGLSMITMKTFCRYGCVCIELWLEYTVADFRSPSSLHVVACLIDSYCLIREYACLTWQVPFHSRLRSCWPCQPPTGHAAQTLHRFQTWPDRRGGLARYQCVVYGDQCGAYVGGLDPGRGFLVHRDLVGRVVTRHGG